MDTADGIGAGPSKRIEAMRDSRVGAIGVQSLIIILILQIAAIMKLSFYAPFAFPLAAFGEGFPKFLQLKIMNIFSKKNHAPFIMKAGKACLKK